FAEVDRLFDRQPKFTRADFIPLCRLIADPCVIIVNDQQPWKTLKELVEEAKKSPNEIIMSSSGLYGALHIPMSLFSTAVGGLQRGMWLCGSAVGGFKLRHLPTTGGGPALTALLGNNAQVAASSITACIQQIKAGKARALASFGAKRSGTLPDVPTLKELG